jgi:hypothetical protein
MSKVKRILAYLVLAIVVVGGCAMGTLSQELTPCRADKDVVAYNVKAGVGDANDYIGILGYPSLASVLRLQADFTAAVILTDQQLQHIIEKKKLNDDILGGTVDNDVEVGVAREDMVFNPTTGVLAIGLSMFGIAGAGYLGLMRKRPQDITPKEMEAALGDVKGEIDDRDRKIISLISSMKNVIEAQPADAQEKMVALLKAGQSPETRVAVKQALALL